MNTILGSYYRAFDQSKITRPDWRRFARWAALLGALTVAATLVLNPDQQWWISVAAVLPPFILACVMLWNTQNNANKLVASRSVRQAATINGVFLHRFRHHMLNRASDPDAAANADLVDYLAGRVSPETAQKWTDEAEAWYRKSTTSEQS